METSVTLQDNFHISPWLILGIIALAIGIALLFVIPILKKKKKDKPKSAAVPVQQIQIKPPFDPQAVKSKYLMKVFGIQQELAGGLIDDRKASQQLSAAIRDFVNEMTGLNVQNYTLTEIRTLGIPALEELIGEYYSPEFSEEKGWDSAASIEKTKRAIGLWM